MNRLALSTSPYLLQHAHNPVDWYAWGDEALSRAKAEDKPIFLSIGYAACHWCHVMAHESFEDAETAAFMNANFINIKVDREQRPDIDGIYMQAVVAMTGSGGWPMSVFLSPDLKPFFAGTYFPPLARYGMPAFKDVLAGLAQAWSSERGEIERVGTQIRAHLQSNTINQSATTLDTAALEAIATSIRDSYDWGFGGWGSAPKFPQPMVIEFLLVHGVLNHNDDSIRLVSHCLHAMARGGMYDVVGGGFARYSTDNHWRVPHFEKMLYDNAQLARAYLHGWQLTRDQAHRRVARETLDFVARELLDARGGFYSSLDADSEGVEGKFYVWSLDEIRTTLGGAAEFFEAAYALSAQGNWEGSTVLQRALDDASLAARFKLDLDSVPARLAESHARLLAVRAARVRPATDDKVLMAWNGLMLAAFAEAARALDDVNYLRIAQENAAFLLNDLRPAGRLRRAWRAGTASDEVFLEDYAALILGLLELYQSDFNNRWFQVARDLAEEMIERFSDPAGGFFDTPSDAAQLLIRPKDLQDNATPCGNALACEALLRLSSLSERQDFHALADSALAGITDFALKAPLGFARWLSAAEISLGRTQQIAVLGEAADENFQRMIKLIRAEFRPGTAIATSAWPIPKDAPGLLEDRTLIAGRATAFICEGFVCRQPTNDFDTFVAQLMRNAVP